jgi:hypothetical protein
MFRYVQIKNPKTKKYTVIDKKKGLILGEYEKKKRFIKEIKIKKQKGIDK